MAAMMIFLLPLLVSLATANTAQLSNNAAAEKAVAYLWSQTNETSFKWPEGEIPTAILGLASAKPPIQGGKFKNQTEQLIVNINLGEMGADFLKKMIKPEKGKHSGNIENIDLPTLIQYIGVLQVSCMDPHHYLGFDLIQEALNRLDSVTQNAPTYGAIILAICNADKEGQIKRPQIEKLARNVPTLGKECPFCVERSAMNILALACIANKNTDDESAGSRPSPKTLRGHIGQYAKYIDSVQDKVEGGFGSLFATSLAIQARLSTKVKFEYNIDLAWRSLKSAQKPDGSFGQSITFTTIALPALTGQTATDIKRIPCKEPPKKPSPTFVAAYELEDGVFSQQKFRGRLVVNQSTKLLKALQDYSEQNPSVFKLETEKSPLGIRIVAINGIRNDPGSTAYWFVDELHKDGKIVPISAQLDSTALQDSDHVVYRMAYRLANLSL